MWRDLSFVLGIFLILALPGITVAGFSFYWTKYIHHPWSRVLVRSVLVSIALTPGIIGPHEAIWPAVLIFVLEPVERLYALSSMLVVWALAVPVVYVTSKPKIIK
jgi:hypothetical protein